MSSQATEIHRWTRRQYEEMTNTGVFREGERVELVEGYIIDMAPQSSIHASTIRLVEDALRLAFAQGFDVRAQMPLALDQLSEPEPDIAVVPGNPRDYLREHPKTAVLVVEVASASIKRDRGVKKSLYAKNNIQDYWIVNLDEDCLEVYRNPHGHTYRSERRLLQGDRVQPLAATGFTIKVADLLP